MLPQMVSLMKDVVQGTIETPGNYMSYLGVGDNVALAKLAIVTPRSLLVSVRWDKSSGDYLDLDLGCMMLGSDASLVDFASFLQKQSRDGCVQHGGDNCEEANIVDKEVMRVDLSGLPTEVHFLAFCLSSFTGKSLMEMKSCDVTLVDTFEQRALVVSDCVASVAKEQTAVLICLLFRTKTGWYFQNASCYSEGLLLRDNLECLQEYIHSNPSIMRAMTKHRRDSI